MRKSFIYLMKFLLLFLISYVDASDLDLDKYRMDPVILNHLKLRGLLDYSNKRELNKKFLKSVKFHKNIGKMIYFLDKGADINFTDKQGATALHYAALQGSVDLVKVLLSMGINPNIQTEITAFRRGGETALHYVAHLMPPLSRNYKEIFRLLLSHGADPTIKNGRGYTALFFVASDNALIAPEIIDSLVSYGADPNTKNEKGWTPLFYAKNPRNAKALLSNGADVNIQDEKTGRTVLHNTLRAAYQKNDPFGRRDHPEIAKVLLPYADVNIQDNKGRTVLHESAIMGDWEIFNFILSKTLDIDIKSNNQVTALFEASANGQPKIVKLLRSEGADIRVKSLSGLTTLHMASRRGYIEIVRFLLSEGADINDNDNIFKRTPLHEAVRNGHLDIVELLINEGADTLILDKFGQTPAQVAINKGYTDILARLIVADL